MPAAICATAHTIPDTPTPEDQTRIVVQDWNTLKTELNSFWPSFTDDFAYSKNALKKTMLLFHPDTAPKWKHDIHGHTYRAICQYLNMVLGYWNQESAVPTDTAVLERPELGMEPFRLAPGDCVWHPPAPQQPLVRSEPSPWDGLQSTVGRVPEYLGMGCYAQQQPDAEYQNQNTTSNASSSSTYGTSQDTWANWSHRGADHGRGSTH